MTKNQEIAQELKEEFAKGNLKPSQLKRSKSLGDLTKPPAQISPIKEEIYQKIIAEKQATNKELQQTNSQLQDQVLELRIGKLKDFGEYLENKNQLETELNSTVDYGLKEIERLENKLRNLNKKKLTLEQQVFATQSEARKWELKAIDLEPAGKTNLTENKDYNWEIYLLISVGLFCLFNWLLSKGVKNYD